MDSVRARPRARWGEFSGISASGVPESRRQRRGDRERPFDPVFAESQVQDAAATSGCEVAIFHLGGALNEREDDDGAVGNRDVRYISGFAGTWPPGTPAEPHVAWVRGAWEAIRPFSTGGNYVNFQLAEDDATRTADAYGDNYERLRRVKAEYDPDNLFRVNRNIPPVA